MSRAPPESKARTLSVGVRDLRDIGNAFGFSVDRDALDELGLVEDGELVEDVAGRQRVTSDGKIVVNLEGVGDDDAR